MYRSTYFIDKSTNTFSDNLAAFGLAFVLNAIADGRAKVRMEDKGYAFAVICEPAIREEWVEKRAFFVGAPLLITLDSQATKKQEKIIKTIKGTKLNISNLPEADGIVIVDYEHEKQVRSDFFKWRDTLSIEEKEKLRRGEIAPPVFPHMNWDTFRAINTTGAIQSHNSVVGAWWQTQAAFPEFLKILLAMASNYPNDISRAKRSWDEFSRKYEILKIGNVTASQLLNPTQGKGTNSRKSEWSEPNQEKSFWLLEWLKVVGLYEASISRIVSNPRDPTKAKDRKTYVVAPVMLGWQEHQRVMRDFKHALIRSEPPVKLDILTSLRYTYVLLKFFEGARTEDIALEIFGHSAVDLVSGMQMALYKSMSKALVILNLAQINLPRWVAPKNPTDLLNFQESVLEHISIIRNLNEMGEIKNKNFSDQYALLTLYRNFLSGNNVDSFLEFTTAYSGFIISQKERGQFVRQFSIPTLEAIFMNIQPDYSQILQSKGFRDIAYAIRHATVTAQYRKANRDRYQVRYDVRYGLGQSLARKANYPADFLAELSKFLHEYNAETSQVYERLMGRYSGNIPDSVRRQTRRRVETTAIEDITKLLGMFNNDSKLICNMLVAFGYASEARPNDALKEDEIQVDEDQSGEDESSDEE